MSTHDVTSVRLVQTLTKHRRTVTRPAWSPDGSLLATPDDDGTIRVCDVPGFATRHVLHNTSRGRVYSISWSPDGRFLAASMDDPHVRIWDVRREEVIIRLPVAQGQSVHSVAWSPDGQFVAAGARSGVIKMWRASDWKPIRQMEGHNDWVNSIAWSPDSKQIVSGGGDCDKTVRVWDVASGEEKWRGQHRDFVLCVAWSRDNRVVASGSNDNTIRVWHADTGIQVAELQEHTDQVRGVSFSADSSLLASKSRDGSVKVFSTESWTRLAMIEEAASGRWAAGLAFHPSLPLLVTLGQRGSDKDMDVRIWEIMRWNGENRTGHPPSNAAARPIKSALISDPASSQEVQSTPPGEWSLPMSMTEVATRMGNMAPATARAVLQRTGLRRISRKLVSVRLDTLDIGLRTRVEQGRPPKAK